MLANKRMYGLSTSLARLAAANICSENNRMALMSLVVSSVMRMVGG